MAEATKLATAYYELVAAMPGAESQITSALVPAASSAGAKAGTSAGAAAAGGLSAKLAAVNPGVIAAATTAAAGAAVVGLYKLGETFDEVSDTIRTGTGASGDALDGLVDVAHDVATSVPTSFEQAGTAVADLNTRLGLTGDDLEKVASQYLEAGRILGEEVDIQATTAAFSAFGIAGADVSTAMDELFRVSQATGVGMNDLASSVQSTAPALQQLGFSFGESAALVGMLDKAGINSSATLSAMSKGLVALARDGEQPQEAFSRVTGEIENFIAAGDQASALKLASEVFGTKGAQQMVAALQTGALSFEDISAAAGTTSDTILGVGQETMDAAEHWQVMKNVAMEALEPIASAVFDGIGQALQRLTPYLKSFAEWAQENPGAIQAIAAALGVFAVAMGIATIAQWAMNSALLASPVTWIILGIVALVAAVALLVANWEQVSAWLASVWDAIAAKASEVWGGIRDFFVGVWDGITSKVSGAWNAITTYLTQTWENIKALYIAYFNGIRDFLAGIWDSITSKVSAVWEGIKGLLSGAWASITGLARSAMSALGNAISSGWNNVLSFFRSIPGKIKGALGNLGSLLVNAGKQIIQGFLTGLKSAFNNVKSFVGGIGSWIASHKGPRAYDLALLVPAGTWIMTGLRRGLESQVGALESDLAGITRRIEDGVRPTLDVRATARGAGATLDGSAAPAVQIIQNNPVAEPSWRTRDTAAAGVRLAMA